MFVAVADFNREGVVADVAFDVHAKVNLDQITFLQDHVALPSFNTLNHMIGGKMSRQVVYGNRSWEGRFTSVAMNEALGGLNDFMEGLTGLKFKFHRLKRTARHVTCVAPILQLRFFHHSTTLCEGTMPSLITVTSTPPSDSVTLRMVLPIPPGQSPSRMAMLGNPSDLPAS